MCKILLSVIGLVAFVAVGARAETITAVGKWRWNPAESHYDHGAYATEQTMEITKLDKTGITVSQVVTLKDGKTFNWTTDAPFDDKMRHASTWMSFAFSRISDTQFHDRYVMDDGQEGEETFTVEAKRITIRGASTHEGKKQPYVEVWDRVDGSK